jgi:hypothetical protein
MFTFLVRDETLVAVAIKVNIRTSEACSDTNAKDTPFMNMFTFLARVETLVDTPVLNMFTFLARVETLVANPVLIIITLLARVETLVAVAIKVNM